MDGSDKKSLRKNTKNDRLAGVETSLEATLALEWCFFVEYLYTVKDLHPQDLIYTACV